MIYWGNKQDRIGGFDDVPVEKCGVCSKSNNFMYLVDQGYFTLYGMALFPTKKNYYKICSDCSSRLKVRQSDPNLQDVKNAVPGKVKFKYVWGWLVIVPIIAAFTLLVMSLKENSM